MEEGKNSIKSRGRASRVNKFILIVALLWIATTVALLWEAQPGRQSVHRVPSARKLASRTGLVHRVI